VRTEATSEWFSFSMRVNGVEFHEAYLRSCGEQSASPELVIRDRQLGSFALHEEFLLEILERKGDNVCWCPVSLPELKDAVWKEAQMTDSNFGLRTSPSSSSFTDLQGPAHCRIERIPVEGDTSHIDRLENSLTQARIRYRIVGGLDSRGRSWGHLTVAVSSLLGAGMCLRRRAGFLESPESKYVLIDSRTGWKVRLLEDRPRRSR
jgi:hypothetical protein